MNSIIDNPFAVFAVALVTQWGAAFVGDLLRRRIRPLKKARTTKRPKPTRLARNIYERIYCRPKTRQKCASF